MTDFFIADHHFGHKNILKFENCRKNMFNNIGEHNEYLVEQHNKVVQQQDKVYFLGDLTFHHKYLPLLSKMNGSKYLIAGNHDMLKGTEYAKYFKRIGGALSYKKDFIITHIPVHEDQLRYRWKYNIHGHLHSNSVMKRFLGFPYKKDSRYICVSCEHVQLTPISFEEILEKHKISF